MAKFLWTGECEYSMCGHHVTDHDTWQALVDIATQESPTVTCRGGSRTMSYPTRRSCHCDEFRPYRIAREDEKEVIEKQIQEVIEE